VPPIFGQYRAHLSENHPEVDGVSLRSDDTLEAIKIFSRGQGNSSGFSKDSWRTAPALALLVMVYVDCLVQEPPPPAPLRGLSASPVTLQLLFFQVQFPLDLAEHLIINVPLIPHADHGSALGSKHFLPEAVSGGGPIDILGHFTPIQTCATLSFLLVKVRS
jgi:hypothetical protein